jgi:hypothetical protein
MGMLDPNQPLGGLLSGYADWYNRGGLSGMLGMTPWDQQSMREQAMGFATPLVMRGPYAKLPDSLMGFRKSGENVGFEGTNFPHTQHVRVTLDNGETFVDAIKGLNPKHAIERAYRNWGAKDIEPITAEQAAKIDPGIR